MSSQRKLVIDRQAKENQGHSKKPANNLNIKKKHESIDVEYKEKKMRRNISFYKDKDADVLPVSDVDNSPPNMGSLH